MNWLDLVLLLVIALSVLAGFFKGFARTSFGLLSLVLALACGLWFYPLVAGWVDQWVSSVHAANMIGFAIIFVGVLIAGALLGALVAKLLQVVHLSWLDRLLGGAFGVIRGVLLGAVLILVMMAFSVQPPPRSVARSQVAPYVLETARGLAAAAPHEMKEGFRKSYDKVKEAWKDAVRKHPQRPAQTSI